MVVAIIFGLVFNWEYGLINNYILIPLGIEPVRWLLDPTFVLPSIIILGLWRYTGINALYFMAGLQSIPEEVKEAALMEQSQSLAAVSPCHSASAAASHDICDDLCHHRFL